MTIETIQEIFLALKKYDNLLDEKRNNITDTEEKEKEAKEKENNHSIMQKIQYELNKNIQVNDNEYQIKIR